ncbi:ABC transporter ATP-binding protein [Fibrobacterota bacterium]
MSVYSLQGIIKERDAFSLMVERCRLHAGEIYAVLGPNGSGKTTFLDLLSMQEEPEAGVIFFQGRKVPYHVSHALMRNRRLVSYQMQHPYLFNMSVMENICYGLKLRKVPKAEQRKKASTIMEKLSLSPLAERNARSLSGGEAQRVALARSLVLDAEVYLLDEPTANVDSENIREVENIIRSLGERKTAVVFSTHTREQAFRLTENIYTIMNGRLQGATFENIFSGVLREERDGLKSVALAGGLQLTLSKGLPGPVTLSINPRDIILSHSQFESSALNSFKGNISKIEAVNGSLKIFVDTGTVFCALITHKSFFDMGLNIGKSVWLTFKANAVKVFQ